MTLKFDAFTLFKTTKHCVVTIGSVIWEWAIPEKNQTGGVEDFFEKPLKFLGFSL